MRYLTDEENQIASRFLYLNTAIEILQKKESETLEKAIKLGIEERRKLKKIMFDKEIKILHKESDENFASFMFYAGIRQVEKKYFRPALTKHVKNAVDELVRQK